MMSDKESWKKRVKKEHKKLGKKIIKLDAFMNMKEFQLLELDQVDLLERQWGAMVEYHFILEQRLKINDE
jgi:hypothetical protein